ncbi:MAG: hypothetical protein A4E20_06255 [Nitrospira sp. SG-bin2]|jgi:hypothetical protein|uniref:hypothetical protein n=1 Tax=Nitrospira cf. moscoviensis SBR1015 TaxID=96242 RepID=UPI000A0E7704|nr:hypothetical protein [Nitrospira cf. moscoviensis SBR1015]OQW36682.1 MAG: hypothetical protein A4E20_06255 [Nitrospira sp. SG-bin2]
MDRDFQKAYRESIGSILERLEKALQWLGLEHGRVASYKKLLTEYYEGQRSNEHFLAFYQAMDALSIYELWKDTVVNFPGLQAKIAVVFKKGPLLPENENAAANSNRPRNDGFVFIIGGKFLRKSDEIIVSIDGIKNNRAQNFVTWPDSSADVLLWFQDSLIRVECKRPMNSNSLTANVEMALSQIASCPKDKTWGVIAVDVSKLIEQPGHYLEATSLDAGSDYLTDRVAEILLPFAKQYRQEWLLGFIGFASIPMVATVRSQILQQSGKPYEISDLRTASFSWVSIRNPQSSKADVLTQLQSLLVQNTHGLPQNSLPMH